MKRIIAVPEDVRKHVIGAKHRKLHEIEEKAGVRMTMTTEGAVLEGSEEAVETAKEMIHSIIEKRAPKKLHNTVLLPMESYGSVLGNAGATIQSIQKQTNTKIVLDNDAGCAYISGATEQRLSDAENLILKAASRKPKEFVKVAFIDDAYIGENQEFELEEFEDDSKMIKYKLTMNGDKLSKRKEVDYLPMLKEALLEVLSKIYEENQENKNLRTDMWCHFGHAYICDVDEDDADKVYQIKEIIQNLQKQENRWKIEFKEGLEAAEVDDLVEDLSKQPYKVDPYIRFDRMFVCPSGREVRFKAFSAKSSSEPDQVSFKSYEPLLPMKNVLGVVSTESIKCYLCEPYTTRLKVDIFLPYLKLDFHLVVRTTLKETSSVGDKEEDEILINFLKENLTIKDGKLELREEKLPDNFFVNYWRESKRRMYPYRFDDIDFSVTISEEESRQLTTEKRFRSKTDIQIHCDEWDQLLDQDNWKPETIVSKLPIFLDFVREVQSNIKSCCP